MEAALLLRGHPRASGEMVDKGREYAGLTLVDMARERVLECRRRKDSWNGPSRDRSRRSPGSQWGIQVFQAGKGPRLSEHPGERRQQDTATGL